MPDTMPEDSKKLILLDGNSLLYRGFFAMRALTTSAGTPTNAVFSYTMMVLTLLQDQHPDVIVCAWDAASQPTFRHEEYKEYKGTRKAAPDELKPQAPIAREMTEAFNIPQLEAPGFEADDIIGTLATRGAAQGYQVIIVSGDLDALQLVQGGISVMTTVKGVTDTVLYDEDAVVKRYGLKPVQLTDYRALKGDTSDNIPGVPGVGEKTATTLLQQYETIENLIEHLDEVKPAKLQAALVAGTEQMRQSKRLATIIRDVPLEGVELPELSAKSHQPNWAKVRELFEQLEFRTLLRRVPKATGESDAATAPTAPEVDLEAAEYNPFAADSVPAPVEAPPSAPVEMAPAEWSDVETDEDMQEMLAQAKRARQVGIRILATAENPLDADILGIAIATGDGRVFYALLEQARILLEDPTIPKVCHDVKRDTSLLLRHNTRLEGIAFDTEIAAYLLNAGRRGSFPLQEVVSDYAGRELHPLDKKERKGLTDEEAIAHERSETLAASDAILATQKVQEPRLSAENLLPILRDLDLPVAPILAEMELAGLMVNRETLSRLSEEMGGKIAGLETQIFELAGGAFSIGSTKQLQEVLFEKLKLPANRKTKTGYSTGAEVLEELAPDYPIVGLIMQHRGLTKLKSTYTDAMGALVRPETGRLYTTLNQTVAATGRLSSSNPNLQNIPIRTAVGREIRQAFIAPPGQVLVSADYSQIELRLFAHVSQDPELIAAFSSGEDIHKYTAGKMYSIPVSEVTSDMRRAAKTVNYAVIYGITEFALARRLGISFVAAKELKTSYFARFPGIRRYLDETLEFAKEHGYVQTLMGRRRFMPDINSRVFQFRQAAERAATNMPIQGSSADIMKLAMIKVHDMLKAEKMQAKMLLQVHDELLFETVPEEVPALAARVSAAMRDAYPLSVALDVEVKTGRTWADVTPVAEQGDTSEVLVTD